MSTSNLFIASLLALCLTAFGCVQSPRSRVMVEQPTLAHGVLPASTVQAPAFVTLGAGDALGTRIRVLDVYLAALERMGPPEPSVGLAIVPVFAAQPAPIFAVVPSLGPVTGDVSVPLALVD